jgi:hypothetical protein
MAYQFRQNPTMYRGLTDMFPSLGAWIQGNREKVNAPLRERSTNRALGLLGEPGNLNDDFERNLYEEETSPTGLMADPESFYSQMKYGLGLMAIPGYESAGQDFASQAMQSQLGLKQARQEQANWQVNQDRLKSETDEAKLRAEATEKRLDKSAYQIQTGAIYKDYVKAAEPYRTAADLMTNVDTLVQQKGISGMSLIDDIQLVKSYAKMLLPKEAVMEGDISALTRVDITKNPELGVIRTYAAKLLGTTPLTDAERIDLYDAMHRNSANSYQNYAKLRETFEQKAVRGEYNPDDVRRADMAPGGQPSLMSPAMRQEAGLVKPPPPSEEEEAEQARINEWYEKHKAGQFSVFNPSTW